MQKFLSLLAFSLVIVAAPAAASTVYFHQEGVASSLGLPITLPGAGKYNIEVVTELQSASAITAQVRAEWDYWHGTPQNPGAMTIFGNEGWLYDHGAINGRFGSYLQFEVPANYTQVVPYFPGSSVTGPGPYFMLMEFKYPQTQVYFNGFAPGAYSVTISSAPEPTTWALMILGFAAVGGALRKRSFSVRPEAT